MIKIENANKYFNRRRKNEIHIIDNTSLDLEEKGLVAILGESGSGKTTLLNAIGGLDKVNSGKIYINSERITGRTAGKIDKIRNLNVGYIFQDYKLIENMSVFDNVAITLKMIGIKNKKEIEKRVNYVLNAVNMYRYRNRPAQMLSGGEQQRVAIARAIVKNPSIVIADEPTGNLDSKNSLEIMNIIKAISKEKLVLLVTHEVNLAKFYATRIVELKDGKIVNDYQNEVSDDLEYRVENKIYLQDFSSIKNIKDNNLNIDIFSNEENPELDIKLVFKNGNILIEAKNKKIEVIHENSGVELINDHYKKIDKSIYEQYNYNLSELEDNNFKPKYSSIYGIFRSIKVGFNRILNYSILKKILLLGFFFSSIFVLYSVCNIAGALDIRESDYITIDKNYLQVSNANISVDDYLKYEKLDYIDYLIPGDSQVSFKIRMDNYYQLSTYSFELSGSLVDISKINSDQIIKGRMPENEYEIVIDKKVSDNMLNDQLSMIKSMGIKTEDELMNRLVTIDGMKDFKIVGIIDNLSASIYVDKSLFINILNNMTHSDYGMAMYIEDTAEEESETIIKDYKLYLDDITLTKGRYPDNDYEVIVNKVFADDMKLNKTIKAEVNGKKLTVVGYYDSKVSRQDYLVSNNKIKYNFITNNNGLIIYPKDKQKTLDTFLNEYNLNIYDRFEKDKKEYLEKKHNEIRSAVIFAGVILAISLIEIYLMIRSSFLSRIKEIGVFRAIGVKKKDIYRMFLGEILSITTIASMPGIALMSYILSQISKIPYLDRIFVVDIRTIGISIGLIYLFNILVGLLPLFKIITKTPAGILARHDVE